MNISLIKDQIIDIANKVNDSYVKYTKSYDESEEKTPLLEEYRQQRQQLPQQGHSQQQQQLPQQLTHQLYVDIRRNEQLEQKKYYWNYLNFMDKTYYQNFMDCMKYSLLCTKCSFRFLISSIFPDAFQHSTQDIIVKMSENILDEYSSVFQKRADNYV